MTKAVASYARDMVIYMMERAHGGRSVVVSRRDFVTDLRISATMASYALRYLQDLGFVEVTSRFGQNGGQLENMYTVTDAGAAFASDRDGGPRKGV